MDKDLSQKIRENEMINYYRSQVLQTLMNTIKDTRPELALDLKAGKEGLQSTLQSMGLIQQDVNDLNKRWLESSTVVLEKIWEGARITAEEFVKTLKDASTPGTPENK